MRGARTFAWIAIGMGVTAIVATSLAFFFRDALLELGVSVDPNYLGSFGAFIGGIVGPLFALAGVLLLITSFAIQKDAFVRQQVEDRFYRLIDIARKNSDYVQVKDRDELIRELYESYSVVHIALQIATVEKDEQINIAYLAFFYGAVGEAPERILRERLSTKLESQQIDALLAAFRQRRAEIESDRRLNYAAFDGHQSRLGHYYRHLYQTVTYVNQQPQSLLSSADKYQYVKMLRAQLSTQEQVLLLWNSLSDLGAPWEKDASLNDPNLKLITKYNLIKNIPDGYSKYVDPRHYYPLVAFEGHPDPLGRAELERTYGAKTRSGRDAPRHGGDRMNAVSVLRGVAALVFGTSTESLARVDHASELISNEQLRNSSAEAQQQALQEAETQTEQRIRTLRRTLLLSFISMGSAAFVGWLGVWFSVGIPTPRPALVVASVFCFAFATLGRLGWTSHTWSGRSSVERLDQALFHVLYWLGMYLATVSAS